MNKQEHEALRLCVESLDQLLPYLAKVPADVGLLNDALVAARPLLKQEPAPAQDDQSPPCDYCGVIPDHHPWHGSGMFNGEDSPHIHACNDCRHLLPASPAQAEHQHSDDAAVDRFAAAMKAKLAKSRAKGRGGWDDPNVCSVEFLAQLLVEHLGKGNAETFEDVANFAMMLHQRGADPMVLANATRPAQTEQQPVAWARQCDLTETREKFARLQPYRRPGYDVPLYAAPVAQTEQQPVEVMPFQFKHPDTGDAHAVALTRQEVADGMEDTLYEKLADLICHCEPVGETNVVDCNCDDYIYEFELVNAAPIAQTAPQTEE